VIRKAGGVPSASNSGNGDCFSIPIDRTMNMREIPEAHRIFEGGD
jgi:hypothetical protein